MNFFLKNIFLLICLLFITNLHAQKSFSRDSAKFIEEYNSFVNNINSSEAKEVTKLFKTYWSTGKIPVAERNSINQLANEMLMNNFNPNPHFLLLTQCINAWVGGNYPIKLLSDFLAICQKNMIANKLGMVAYMNTIIPLFSQNIINESGQKKWFMQSRDFTLNSAGDLSISFGKGNFVCKGPIDSMVIENTSGIFFPDKNIWKATSGRVTWARHGNMEAFVEFSLYEIDLSSNELIVQNALYTNKKYFAGIVKGQFKDKVSYSTDSNQVNKSSFPEFSTYESAVEIKNLIGTSAKYFGGLSVKGTDIFSQSIGDRPAKVELLFKGKPKIIAYSSTFKIVDSTLMSQSAEITVLMDTGTVYHPQAIFNFNFRKNFVVISRGEAGLTRVNFIDNYHNLAIETDHIKWDLSTPFVDFDNISNDKAAAIESSSFYKQFRYEKIQGMLAYNPIELIMAYLMQERVKKFYLPDYAKHRKNTKQNLQQQIYDLADDGFIRYDPKTDTIFAQPKLYNYYFNNMKTKDYDVIRFSSVIAAKSNATLNLLNNNITIEGVRRFNFSDSQNVIALPTEQTISVKGDRTFMFGGMMRAGRFDLFSKNFIFDYHRFAILPTTIDSLRLYFPDSNNSMRKVNSVLTNLYGTLEIDKPTNKSGLIDFPEYPRFKSEKGSEITYDRPETHNNAYKAGNFKFIVDPFEIDSMDNFTVQGLQFDGTFISDDIFPDFRYKASIQEDFSLGFKTSTPTGGYPMYKGKGKGDMLISLSNRGLYGTGKMEYNGSTVESESFLLLPGKSIATAKKFTMPESVKYPAVVGSNLATEFNPYSDNMAIKTSGEEKLKVFKMGYDFSGTMKVTPTAIKGDGILTWNEAEFTSSNMTFATNGAKADTSAIKIYAADPAKIAFQSGDLKSNLDFTKREGKFVSNIAGSLTQLPFNKYASNLNDYKWNMDAGTLDINLGNMAGIKPYFVATNDGVDSLKFEAKHALFNIKTGVLAIDQIPYIDVADSRVFPSDGKAIVRENAVIDRLDSSKIDANRDDKFHQFFNCKTYIWGRNSLRANGLFKYENKNGKQQIFFDSIYASNKIVLADAYIKESQNFEIDRKIAYQGIMRVKGYSSFPHLIGFVKPLHGFDSFPSKWARYRDSIDRNNVVIYYGIPQDEDGRKLPNGIYAHTDGSGYYPSFQGWKTRYTDDEITADTGVLYYDYTKKLLVMGAKAKLFDRNLIGNHMTIDPVAGRLDAYGRLDFGFEYKDVRIDMAGQASYQKLDTSFTFNTLNIFKFPMPKEITAQIAKMATDAGGVKAASNTPDNRNAFGAFFDDEKEAIKATNGLNSNNKFYNGSDADGLLVFRINNLRHVPAQRALYSKSGIELYQVGDNLINTTFDCLYEIEKKRSGDNFTIYIEFTKNDWIYINFIRGVFYILSSDPKFNEQIPLLAEKADKENFSLRLAPPRSIVRLQDSYAEQP